MSFFVLGTKYVLPIMCWLNFTALLCHMLFNVSRKLLTKVKEIFSLNTQFQERLWLLVLYKTVNIDDGDICEE
jgi:hypothetical protein